MAELTFKSAGVSTREIDLSQPSRSGPVGVPAGIIGTSLEGPAFIPLTFANFSDFIATFGASDGEKFGPIAVSQWLSNAQAVTYMRVLGVGDGKQRNSNGNVTNAGFTVGDRIVQDNGIIGNNSYANSGTGDVEGRTYLLGCFMSASAGSSIFSDAGIQTNSQAVPILRGVLLAPSGVILHLSGNGTVSTGAPSKSNTANTSKQGHVTGSLNLGTQEFVMLMNGYSNPDTGKKTTVTASFDMTSPDYFANVFNTNPHKIEEEGHLLYASYDIYPDLAATTGSGAVTAGVYSIGASGVKEDIAFLLTSSFERGEATASTEIDYESFNDRFTHAVSPFVISQGGTSAKNLFRIHALSDGAGISNRYKISIENIRKSTSTTDLHGTFDLVVRDFRDSDEEPIVLESFRGLSLDPSGDRYIGRVIGDQNIRYNFDVAANAQKIVVEGSHPVSSRFVRVEISQEVKDGSIDDGLLPFGFRGHNHLVTSGSLLTGEPGVGTFASTDLHKRLVQPPIPFRESIALGTGIRKKSDQRLFWGVQTNRKTDPTQTNLQGLFDNSFESHVKHFPTHRTDTLSFSVGNNAGTADVGGTVLDSDRFNNGKFTLENVLVRTGSDTLADPEHWLSASYVRGGGISANVDNKTRAFSVDDLGKVANTKFAKFTFLLQGGFDGVNIFDEEKSKLSTVAIRREIANEENSAGVLNNTVSSYRKAINLMSSKTDVDIQLLAIPGIRHPSVTDYAVQKIEDRFDAMFIMDIEERDQVNSYITSSLQKPHVSNTVSDFKNRGLNTSFAAAYFPDVVVEDPSTSTLIQVPPSVAVLGAYSFNDAVAHPWFAPAGFARGGLNTVEMASVRLNRTNLDDLYEADINPITEFPNTGICIWGQKTLLAENTALDRINVRRLLIDVRRKIRNIANSLLFEPNREETLERFSSLANPILQRVQEQSGVDRYKVIIDTTTTTQADVENNTLRGKIFLQPTRSVEFVSLDFVVTNAGSNI